MNYKKAIELRNLLVEDLKKNEKDLTAFLTKANEHWDNEPDWVVCIYEKHGNTIQTPNKVNRLDIRRRVQKAAEKLYENIKCPSLRWIAGELISANEDYVLEHSGDNETYGTLEIMRTGFTINQKKWLNELKALTDEYYTKEDAQTSVSSV